MTKVSVTPVGVGSDPGDGTGDTARDGGIKYNSNDSGLATAINDLASEEWEIRNTSHTLVYGGKYLATSHSGITFTLPALVALNTDDYNTIVVLNGDTSSNITLDAGSNSFQHGLTTSTNTYTLAPGHMAILLYRSAGWWQLIDIITDPQISLTDDIEGVSMTSYTAKDIFAYTGSGWTNYSAEEADLVDRSIPALEATPYMFHTSHGSKASGTESIICDDEPSADITITGDNVTINLDVPTLSLPERGLADVKLCGKVFVHLDGTARTGLTVTTDATDKLGTFPKGTAPTAANEDAILVWEWYNNGTTDFMWAEWLNDD